VWTVWTVWTEVDRSGPELDGLDGVGCLCHLEQGDADPGLPLGPGLAVEACQSPATHPMIPLCPFTVGLHPPRAVDAHRNPKRERGA